MENKLELMEKWLDNTVIGLNLCPFAKTERPSIKFTYLEELLSKKDQELLELIVFYVKDIEAGKYSTALLFGDKNPAMSFADFYHNTQDLQTILNDMGHDYQLIVFHPEFKFEDTLDEDRVNFVNRSPFPCIHLLSNAAVEKVLKETQLGVNINKTNEKVLNELSNEELKKHFSHLDNI